MNEAERREALADFLRMRRARLAPEEVGLPPGGRRRTDGLRREEVALLASVGVSWYTALEQGRDIHPSEQVLESLAETLRLSADEREHLFRLAGQPAPMRTLPADEQISPALQLMIQALDPHPAYVVGRYWDSLLWNRAAELVFALNDGIPPYPQNVIWRAFADPAREQAPEREGIGRALVARFRADSARYPGDPRFAQLIADLQQVSGRFRLWWSQHDVSSTPDCHKNIQHATLGLLQFEQMALEAPTNPDLRVMIYAAQPATAALLERELLVAAR